MNTAEALRVYREFRELRSALALPDFTKPPYWGKELDYSEGQTKKFLGII